MAINSDYMLQHFLEGIELNKTSPNDFMIIGAVVFSKTAASLTHTPGFGWRYSWVLMIRSSTNFPIMSIFCNREKRISE